MATDHEATMQAIAAKLMRMEQEMDRAAKGPSGPEVYRANPEWLALWQELCRLDEAAGQQ